ncbi:MAG: DUF2383 domain-containing protein [Acidobacteriota bacterium]
MPHTQTNVKAIGPLNSLLRGEISAAETYAMAIAKIGSDRQEDAGALRAISQEHGQAAQQLRDEIRRAGGEAEDTSGAWGAYAKTIEGVATLFGDASALKALKEGEEHGLKDYRDALASLEGESKRLVAETLIPAQGRHITTLEGMLRKSS